MVGSWPEATGDGARKMEQDTHKTAIVLPQIERCLHEFQLNVVQLFDHAPVLRIQVPETDFARVLELREILVERIKPFGYRFVAVDLEEPRAPRK